MPEQQQKEKGKSKKRDARKSNHFFTIVKHGPQFPRDARFLFYYLSWFFAILLITGFALVGRNPFRLLLPYSVFSLPKIDSRKSVPIYLSNGQKKLVAAKRKLQWQNDTRQNILALIGEIGKSPFYEMDTKNDALQLNEDLKKLTNLQTSVRVLWLLTNNKRLVIDLRQQTILQELKALKFRVKGAKTPEEREQIEQQTKYNILHSTFLAIEKTIFANFKEIQTIEYRLDGRQEKMVKLDYDLSIIHKRQ